jgi:hypothetical protein
LATEVEERVLGLFERNQHRLLIAGELGLGPRIGRLYASAHATEVEGWP